MLKAQGFPETRPSMLATMRDGPQQSAWREFFDRYAPAVYGVACLRGLHKHDADDIVQQVMIAIVHHISDFDYDRDRGHFRDWVRKITENKVRDHCRKSPTTTGVPAEQLTGEQVDLDEAWRQQWLLQDIEYCLEEAAEHFTPRRVEAFRLYVMDELPASEVATKLGMTVGHVYVTRTQILNRIRGRLRALAARA